MDTIARGMASHLADKLGKAVIVENRTGGGTTTAASAVAKSPPDGNTILIAASGTLTANMALYKALPYHPQKDFVPLALYLQVPFVLVSSPSLAATSIADLAQATKATPGKIAYASTGIGTIPHLAGEMLKSAIGADMAHVPYRGAPPAINDIVGGHVQLMFADPSLVQELIAAGKLRGLGVSSLTRIGALPNLPTLAEQGLPGFDAVSWHMALAPVGTPKDIVDTLHREIKAHFAQATVQQQLVAMGLIPVVSPPPAELATYLATEIERWSKIVAQAGIAGTQ